MLQTNNEVKVWDPLVRAFHWSLVLAFVVAWLSEDELLSVHTTAGYLILGLLGIRVLWGVVGTRHARFSDFVAGPRTVGAYLGDALRLRARRYIGHNPAGGVMILLMLFSLLMTGVFGLAIYGIEEHAGPLAGLFGGIGHDGEEFAEEAHELFANLTLLLVGLHVAGVVFSSLLHAENLVRAMLTGRKRA